MKLETVDYSISGRIARIAMNRPDKHNALSHQLMDDLEAAFADVEKRDDVSVVVLSGNGPSFCSGYDTKGSYYISPPDGAKEWTGEKAFTALRDIEARYQRIWNCPKITIAQVHGNALAAGCYLQLLCDISICADTARLGHPVRRSGITSMPLWQVAVPLKKARYLLMTNRLVDGPTAERFDLVTMCVPEKELKATVDQIAEECAVLTPADARMKKESFNTALEIMGLAAMFRYHGQMNAMSRVAF